MCKPFHTKRSAVSPLTSRLAAILLPLLKSRRAYCRPCRPRGLDVADAAHRRADRTTGRLQSNATVLVPVRTVPVKSRGKRHRGSRDTQVNAPFRLFDFLRKQASTHDTRAHTGTRITKTINLRGTSQPSQPPCPTHQRTHTHNDVRTDGRNRGRLNSRSPRAEGDTQAYRACTRVRCY